MEKHDLKAVFGGLILLAFGLLLAIYPIYHYSFGTLVSMGPGLFPAAIGWLLVALSITIIITGLLAGGSRIDIGYRPLLIVTAAVLLFALAVPSFGMLPAVGVAAVVSSYAEPRTRWVEPISIALAMIVFSVAVFHYGLKLNIPLFAWPF